MRRRTILIPLIFLALILCSPQPARAACVGPPAGVEGQIMYNSTSNVMQYCDNLNVWNAMGMKGAGAGGGGCSGPAGVAGQMMYNSSYHMLQWCDGTTWHAVTGGAAVRSYDGAAFGPTSGLVGWWKLDDGSSGTTPTTAADSSGNGNTGTLVASPTWTSSGKIGNALTLNGTSQYVNFSDIPALDIAGAWTVSTWAKFTSLVGAGCNGEGLLSRIPASGNENYALWLAGGFFNGCGADQGFAVQFASSGGTNYWVNYMPTGGILTNTWYLVTGTWDGTTLTLYVNGVSVATAVPGAVPDSTAGGLQIGNNSTANAGYDGYTAGTLDDVRIYNRALSAAEVSALYNATGAGLIHWWKVDEAPGATTAADSAGTATLSKTGTVDFTTSSKINNGLSLPSDGTLKYLSAASFADIDGASTLTMSMWFKRATSTSVTEIGGINAGVEATAIKAQNDGLIYFEASNNAATTYGTVASADTNWHLATMVYDGTQTGNAARLKGYIDGVQQTLTFSGTAPAALGTGNTLRIGDAGGGTFPYDAGTIDDARIWNRALSAAEVSALYNAGSSGCTGVGLVGWWKFDDGSGTSAADSSGNSHTGTLQNSPTWTTGTLNGALTFSGLNNGSATNVNVSTNLLGGSNTFTITAWINLAGADGGGIGFILGDGITGCMIADGGSPKFHCTNNNGSGPDAAQSGSITLNQWTFVVASRNSAGQWTLYINGVQSGAANQSGASPSDSQSSMFIGANGGLYGFNGTIDDVRVYNRALSSGEVLNLYNNGTDATEGQLMYNATSHVPQFCDGTSWHATK